MAFILRVNPSCQQWRLPPAPQHVLAAAVVAGLQGRGAIEFRMPDVPDMSGLLFLNLDVVESVELVELTEPPADLEAHEE